MDRRVWAMILVAGVVLGVLFLPARGDDDRHRRAVQGRAVRVEETVLVITLLGGMDNGREVQVATDPSTKVMVDNKPATLGDIKPGMTALVTQVDGLTVDIIARTPWKK